MRYIKKYIRQETKNKKRGILRVGRIKLYWFRRKYHKIFILIIKIILSIFLLCCAGIIVNHQKNNKSFINALQIDKNELIEHENLELSVAEKQNIEILKNNFKKNIGVFYDSVENIKFFYDIECDRRLRETIWFDHPGVYFCPAIKISPNNGIEIKGALTFDEPDYILGFNYTIWHINKKSFVLKEPISQAFELFKYGGKRNYYFNMPEVLLEEIESSDSVILRVKGPLYWDIEFNSADIQSVKNILSTFKLLSKYYVTIHIQKSKDKESNT